MLRSGVGLEHGYTRREVAAILHVTVRQEGRIERQATTGLTRASAQGRCANRLTSVRASLLHTLSVLLPLTLPPPMTGSATPTAQPSVNTRHITSGTHHGTVSRATPGQPPPAPKSSSIAPPDEGGLNLLLLLLGAVAGLVALWLVRSRPRSRLSGRAVASLPQGTAGESLADTPNPRHLELGAETVIGATALRPADDAEAASPEPDTPQPESVTTLSGSAGSADSVADGIEAFELGGVLAEKGDMRGAESAYRRADEQGHPFAASNLGVLLEQRGDLTGAEAAYRRADDRGDASGAFNLGGLLEDRNDLLGAEAAYRRADQRGDGGAALRLGALLEERNDLFGAEAAFRRADERGDATGAFKLGTALEKRHDLAGAEAAYRRAAERGQGDVEDLARSALTLLRSRH